MSDILKRPVHVAILKPSHVQKLAEEGKFKPTTYGMDPTIKPPSLPAPTPEKPPSKLNIPKVPKQVVANSNIIKTTQKQLRLRVIHDRVQAPNPSPPCGSCKSSACCYAFVVNITEEEYESGLYGDVAVKLTEEMYNQLHSRYLQAAMLGAPGLSGDKTAYYLDGKISEACPFLTPENKCGIYDIRPITCRSYSCLNDSRISEEMRQGTERIDLVTLSNRRRTNVTKP